MRLPKVKKNSEFQGIFKNGKIWSNPVAVLYLVTGRDLTSRVGICVSKKLGRATVRNRIKRLLHEACRLQWPELRSGYDMIVLARRGVLEKTFAEVNGALEDLFRRARLHSQSAAPPSMRRPAGPPRPRRTSPARA